MDLQGSCLCGAVTFSVIDAFDHFFICHCTHCQKGTGSAFAANLFIANTAVTWLTGMHNVTHYRLPSTRHAKSFCTTCGSALPNTVSDSNTAVVPAGSLNTPPSKRPDAHIFTSSKCLWEKSLADVRSFYQLPEDQA